jgi:capsular polysaccharide biosynthesis protein
MAEELLTKGDFTQTFASILIRHWRGIAGIALLASLLTALIGQLILRDKYEALTMISVTKSSEGKEADMNAAARDSATISRALAALATTDSFYQQVAINLPTPAVTVDQLARQTSIVFQTDRRLLELRSTASTPEGAIQIANTWSNSVVMMGQTLYAASTPNPTVEGELSKLRSQIDDAQKQLTAFNNSDRSALLQIEYDTLLKNYQENLQLQQQIAQALELLTNFRAALSNFPAENQASLEDEITAAQLQIKVFGLSDVPLQPVLKANHKVGELIALVDTAVTTGKANQKTTIARNQVMQARMEELRVSLANAHYQQQTLNGAVQSAQKSYEDLKHDADKAASVLSMPIIRLISPAIRATEVNRSRLPLYVVVVGTAAGLFYLSFVSLRQA